jgi:hypothetical protein
MRTRRHLGFPQQAYLLLFLIFRGKQALECPQWLWHVQLHGQCHAKLQ